MAIALGERERARAIYEELVRIAEEVGDPWNGAVALNNLGDLALYDGDWAKVIELCGRSHDLRLGLGDRWGAALALLNVALAQLALGRLGDAGRSIRTALQENVDIGSTMGMSSGLDVAALLAASAREWTGAAVLLGAVCATRETSSARGGSATRPTSDCGPSERHVRHWANRPSAAAQQRGHGLSREEAVAQAVAIIDALTGSGR